MKEYTEEELVEKPAIELFGQIGWETDSGFRGRIIGDYSKSTGVCCSAVEVLQSSVENGPTAPRCGQAARAGRWRGVAAISVAVHEV